MIDTGRRGIRGRNLSEGPLKPMARDAFTVGGLTFEFRRDAQSCITGLKTERIRNVWFDRRF